MQKRKWGASAVRRLLLVIVAPFLLTLTLSLPVPLQSAIPRLTTIVPSAQAAGAPIVMYLDGKRLESDADPYIVPKANVTMVPLRVISSGLGAYASWTQKTKTVTIRKTGVVIEMKVGNKFATVNGVRVALDASVQLLRSRTMVPLRFIGEQLGLTVKWHGSTRTIALESAAAEVRGAWISTVYNLDWPTKASYGDQAQQRQQFDSLLDDLQNMGMNTVYVQVRPAADALYPSSIAPWSQFLTGEQGADPGYDPLAYMVEETHSRGMSFHAWFNPFRAGLPVSASTDTLLAPNHVAVQHPDWVIMAGKQPYLNPGIPDARKHVIDAIMEVVRKYEIDGVHLDDYFYPSGEEFADGAAYASYNSKGYADIGDWRRDNINTFVKDLDSAIHRAKPQVVFGISPFGVWRNAADDPTGSDTKAGVTTYDDMYADVRTWIKSGWIDYVIPQVYWSLSLPAARYDKIVDWWTKEVDGTDVKLYIGHAPYKLGTTETGWSAAEEIINQLKYNENKPQIRGDVFFSAKDLRRNPLGLIPLLQQYYGIDKPPVVPAVAGR